MSDYCRKYNFLSSGMRDIYINKHLGLNNDLMWLINFEKFLLLVDCQMGASILIWGRDIQGIVI